MKFPVVFLGSLALVTASFAEEKPVSERAADAVNSIKRDTRDAADKAARAVREAWRSTKAYLSQDPGEYRTGAMKKLEGFEGELQTMTGEAQQGPMAGRFYFQTRLKALREHLDYAKAEMAKLPESKDQKDYEAARHHFDRTLQTLEDAIDQAESEAKPE